MYKTHSAENWQFHELMSCFFFLYVFSNVTLKECQAKLCDPASVADCHVLCKTRNGRFKCFCDKEFAFQDMNTG